MGAVTVVTGPARCGKTTELLTRYRRCLADSPPGAALWISPTSRAALDVRGRLLSEDLPACFSPGVMTFEQLAQRVLDASGQPIRPLKPLMQRELIRLLIAEMQQAGRLKHFAAIAEEPGLVDIAGEFIRELKRLEIWPEDFLKACKARGLNDKDRELHSLYQTHQDRLIQHKLFDRDGRFWSARELLQNGQQAPLEDLRLVVLDGFTDFTRTQHEILALLAQRVEEMFISLPLEAEPRRADLFAKSVDTLEKLTGQLSATENAMPRRSGDRPALEHVECHLMGNPRAPVPAGEVEGIELLEASREIGEIELVARRIKQLLTAGCPASGGKPVPPGDVAVVFRSVDGPAPLVREVFTSLGIPCAVESGRPLAGTPIARAMIAILRLVVEDWPFRKLLGLLNNNYLRPTWPQSKNGLAAVAAERAVRVLQVPSGKKALLGMLDKISQDPEKSAVGQALSSWKWQAAAAFLKQLDAALAKLPGSATQTNWAAALESLAAQLGVLEVIEQSSEELAAADRQAWEAIKSALTAGDETLKQLGEKPRALTPRELLRLLQDVLSRESLPHVVDEVGRVRVLSAGSVRALEVPYLFFAGLTERAFPSPDRSDRVYGEAEYRQLRQAGLKSLPLRAQRSQEEMLLFYEVVTRARRGLWLSYPALNEKAEPLLPSPYVTELVRACGQDAGGEPRLRFPVSADLSTVPSETLSMKDARLRGMKQALDGQPQLLAGYTKAQDAKAAANVLSALDVMRQRANREVYSPFEGLMVSDAARQIITDRYPQDRAWSASALETYALCPYRFFAQKLLGLEELGELSLGVDFLRRGSLVHDVLARLHRHINQLHGQPASPMQLQPAEVGKLIEQMLQEAAGTSADDRSLQAALLEIDARTLSAWLGQYLDQYSNYDRSLGQYTQQPLPAHFEVSFGSKELGEDADPLSTPDPLRLSHQGQTLLLQGRIDRIDVGKVGPQQVFNVVDYKSSGTPIARNKAEQGTAIQLELYAIAAQEVLLAAHNALPLQGGYWYVKNNGFKVWREFSDETDGPLSATEEWNLRRQELIEHVFAVIEQIRAGNFPVSSVDERCTSYCAYKTVCRINQVRAIEKTWNPTEPTNPA